jgi:putative hemolysin
MEDPAGSSMLLQILWLLFLTGVNAFFACAEMAIVSVNKNKLNMRAEEGDKKAKQVLQLVKEPTKFLSTIQVAITLSGFFASGSAATGISKQLGGVLAAFNVPYSANIAFVVITIVLSYVTLVLGELVPKRVALQNTEKISMFVVGPVSVVSKIASPFIKLLSLSTNLLLRIFGLHHENLEEQVSEEEIRSMIEAGQENGVFQKYEKEMIESIFEFDDKLADEVMTPRIDVFAIDINDPITDYLDEMLDTRHSRIPVFDGEIDHIIGILYIKDLIVQARKVGFEKVNIRPLLHKPYFIPETKNIDELFKELQVSKQYIAILIDEYGGFSGIVTVEDLVEEVMGPIDDQGDEEEPKIEQVDKDTYLLEGLVTINDVNNQLHLELNSESHDTISGYLLDHIGMIPDEDDKREIQINNVTFRIEAIKDKRIEKIWLHIDKEKVLEPETEEIE